MYTEVKQSTEVGPYLVTGVFLKILCQDILNDYTTLFESYFTTNDL